MWFRLQNSDNVLSAVTDLRKKLDSVFDNFDLYENSSARTQNLDLWNSNWPYAWIEQDGEAFKITSLIPGVRDSDIKITVANNVLTLEGERTFPFKEGYVALRQERPVMKFARSFSLSSDVDLEKTTATLKQGVLIINIPKNEKQALKKISVKSI